MKKRLLALLLAGAMSASLMACGSSDEDKADTSETTEEIEGAAKAADPSDYEYDVFDYVTMGDYKDLDVTLEGDYDYSDQGYQDYMDSMVAEANIYVKDDSQTEIKSDSFVNVDYVGSQDGVAFDGGTATDITLGIEFNGDVVNQQTYIEGFTDGLVGHMVGEEVASEVTFPDNYGNSDLAGQTVTFTFTINYIAKAIDSVDALTDDIVADNFDYDNVEEFKAGIKTQYEKELADNLKSDTQTAVLSQLASNFTVSGVPSAVLDARLTMYINSMEQYYGLTDQTLEEFYTKNGGDYDSMYNSLKESMTENLQSELILEAIAKTEKMELTDEELASYALQLTGSDDLQTIYDNYTYEGYSGENYIKNVCLSQKALDFCVENALVSY